MKSPGVRPPPKDFVLQFSFKFHENYFIRSQVCRTEIIQAALECSDPGASNGVSNVENGPPGAVLITFKEVELLKNLKNILSIISTYLETRTFQKQPDRSQVVGF